MQGSGLGCLWPYQRNNQEKPPRPKEPMVLGSWMLGRNGRSFPRGECCKGRPLESPMPCRVGGPSQLENPSAISNPAVEQLRERFQALEVSNPAVKGATRPYSHAAKKGNEQLSVLPHTRLESPALRPHQKRGNPHLNQKREAEKEWSGGHRVLTILQRRRGNSCPEAAVHPQE